MKIICVGRNYGLHAAELGNEVPQEPVLFLKPDSALVPKNNPFIIPAFSKDIHYECELVIRIGRAGKHIQKKFAHRYIHSIGLGIDFTARDLQQELKSKGLPWEKAKAFDGAAFVGDLLPAASFGDLQSLRFQLLKNGLPVQDGFTGDMLFSIPTLVEEISKYFMLKIGDLIFTGTPAGVGKIEPGDQLEGMLEGQKNFSLNIR